MSEENLTCEEYVEKYGVCTDCDCCCESHKIKKETNKVIAKYGLNLSMLENN